MLPTKFQVNLPFSSGEEAKYRFSRWPSRPQSWIPIGTISANVDLQVTAMLYTMFQVNWPFGSGEEAKIYFQDGSHGGQFGFPTGIIFISF